jgi:hypothetical protein
LLCFPDAVLFSQSRLIDRSARLDRRRQSHRAFSRHEDDHKILRHPAVDPSALFGLTNHIIDQSQYTVLLTAVIGSAVVPTLIAQVWFHPHFEPLEEDA